MQFTPFFFLLNSLAFLQIALIAVLIEIVQNIRPAFAFAFFARERI